jgi:hypothetical protein
MPGMSFSARVTVCRDTCAARATSTMVARRGLPGSPDRDADRDSDPDPAIRRLTR